MQQRNATHKKHPQFYQKALIASLLVMTLLCSLVPTFSYASSIVSMPATTFEPELSSLPDHALELPVEADNIFYEERASRLAGVSPSNETVIATATNNSGTTSIYNPDEFVSVAKKAEDADSDTTITLYQDITISSNIRFYDNLSTAVTLTFTSAPGERYTISPANDYSVKASGYTNPDDRAMFSTQGSGLNLAFESVNLDGNNYSYIPSGQTEAARRGVRPIDWENASLSITNSTIENFVIYPFYGLEAVINLESNYSYPNEKTTLTISNTEIKNNNFGKMAETSLLVRAFGAGSADISNSNMHNNQISGYLYASLLTLSGKITFKDTKIYENEVAREPENNGTVSQVISTESSSNLILGSGTEIYSNSVIGSGNLAQNYALEATVVKSFSGSTVTMEEGAKIYDNEIFGGFFSSAVLCTRGSTFIMNGGEIKNNIIDKKDGTPILFSGNDGVVMSQFASSKSINTITINGGEISGNNFNSYLGAVAGMGANVLIAGGTISNNINDTGRNGATLHGLYSSSSQNLADAKGSLIVSGGTIDAGEGVVLGVGNKNIDDETSCAYPRLLKITGTPNLTGAIELRGPTHVLTLDKSGAEGLSQVYPVLKHGIPHEAPSDETEEYVIVVGEDGLDVSDTSNHFSDYFDYLSSLPGTEVNLGTVVLKSHEVITYTISYELNGGTNNPTNPASYTSESEEITLAAPSRADHQFEGWYTTADFSGAPITTIPAGSEGSITLYAKWSEIPSPSPTPTPSPDPSHGSDSDKNSSAGHMLPNTGDHTISSSALLALCAALAFAITRATRSRS